jgi:hypothetical protein
MAGGTGSFVITALKEGDHLGLAALAKVRDTRKRALASSD